MNLYHGTNAIIETPNLKFSRKELDFGAGFYTTTNYEQAAQFSEKVVERDGGGKVVNIYDFDGARLRELKVLEFLEPDKEWLDFVAANRTSAPVRGDCDIIIGPVANDDVFRTLTLYFAGQLDAGETLNRLKIKKMFNQYVFKSDTALKRLSFVKGEYI
ncbi:MAG: DUF3990 domain-containing protein [Chitinispirillales bacterium]|jgi:hypothetical protein|nr:DUF3990 domain-containing protein [Chitinispirillales bacterium]